MTVFEKAKSACADKETLAKLIYEQECSCYYCSKSEWCDGLVYDATHDVSEEFCIGGIVEWLDDEADDSNSEEDEPKFTIRRCPYGEIIGQLDVRDIVESLGLMSYADDKLVVGDDGLAYIARDNMLIRLDPQEYKVEWNNGNE